jgi:hypothetical protein
LHKTASWAALGGTVLALNTGCFTVARRAYKEAKGASSDVEVLSGTNEEALQNYQAVEIQPIQTDLDDVVDKEFTRVLMRVLRRELMTGPEPVFPGGGPALTLTPQVNFYSRPGTMGSVVGSDKYAVAIFFLNDGDRSIGKVWVVTRSAASRTEPADMATNMAQALADFFRESLEMARPEPEDDAPEEDLDEDAEAEVDEEDVEQEEVEE